VNLADFEYLAEDVGKFWEVNRDFCSPAPGEDSCSGFMD